MVSVRRRQWEQALHRGGGTWLHARCGVPGACRFASERAALYLFLDALCLVTVRGRSAPRRTYGLGPLWHQHTRPFWPWPALAFWPVVVNVKCRPARTLLLSALCPAAFRWSEDLPFPPKPRVHPPTMSVRVSSAVGSKAKSSISRGCCVCWVTYDRCAFSNLIGSFPVSFPAPASPPVPPNLFDAAKATCPPRPQLALSAVWTPGADRGAYSRYLWRYYLNYTNVLEA